MNLHDAISLRRFRRRGRGRGRRTVVGLEEALLGAVRKARAAWGPLAHMSPRLRVQAAVGYRAAVIELRPGLYMVAEVPEQAARSEFGVAPLLAPLMVKAATKAIDQVVQRGAAPQPAPGARALIPAAATALVPTTPQLPALPVASRSLVPVPGSGQGHAALLPAPTLGWADADDLGEVLGCEGRPCACHGRR